jgi:NADH:ubiquinone oxidoreductase subunit 6 (subunit J)
MTALAVILTLGAVCCAILAVRAQNLLYSALWLAGLSVIVSIILFLLGANEMAVIELSLSLGLVTILLVLVISMVGVDVPDILRTKWNNWLFVVPILVLLLVLIWPTLAPKDAVPNESFSVVLWQDRQLDVLLQIALIFSGTIGLLSLFVASTPPQKPPRDSRDKEA